VCVYTTDPELMMARLSLRWNKFMLLPIQTEFNAVFLPLSLSFPT
jgi:hypothetical protein